MPEIQYPIATERLELRRFAATDLDAYYAYERLESTARYELHEAFSYEECMRRVGSYAQEKFDQEGQWASFAIHLPASAAGGSSVPGSSVPAEVGSSTLIGHIALKWGSGGRTLEQGTVERVGEIGWTLAPEYQGFGYATEAARAVKELAFNQLGFRRLEAHIDIRNDASAAICKRLDMKLEAELADNMYLKGEWTSEAIYAVVRQ